MQRINDNIVKLEEQVKKLPNREPAKERRERRDARIAARNTRATEQANELVITTVNTKTNNLDYEAVEALLLEDLLKVYFNYFRDVSIKATEINEAKRRLNAPLDKKSAEIEADVKTIEDFKAIYTHCDCNKKSILSYEAQIERNEREIELLEQKILNTTAALKEQVLKQYSYIPLVKNILKRHNIAFAPERSKTFPKLQTALLDVKNNVKKIVRGG